MTTLYVTSGHDWQHRPINHAKHYPVNRKDPGVLAIERELDRKRPIDAPAFVVSKQDRVTVEKAFEFRGVLFAGG